MNIWSPHKKRHDLVKWCDKYSPRVATYLLFQQYLVAALFLCTVISLPILLPLHITGTKPTFDGDASDTAPQWHHGIKNDSTQESDIPLLITTSIAMVMEMPWRMIPHVALAPIFIGIFLLVLFHFQNQSATVMGRYIHHRNRVRAGERRLMEEALNLPKSEPQEIEQQEESEAESGISAVSGISFPSALSDQSLELQSDFGDDSSDDETVDSPMLQTREGNELKRALQRHKTALPGHEIIVSHYALQVTGLPDDCNRPSFFERIVEKIFSEDDGFTVVRSFLLLDVSQRLKLEAKLQSVENSLEHHRYRQERENNQNIHIFVKGQRRHAVRYFLRKQNRIRDEIETWNQKYESALREDPDSEIRGSGWGFVLFDSSSDVGSSFDKYPGGVVNIDVADIFSDEEWTYGSRQLRLHIEQADEPGDYNWTNISRPRNFIFSTGRNISFHVFLTIFLFFFSTPTALFSSIQSIFSIPLLNWPVQLIFVILGPFGDFIFAWMPAITLHILSFAISKIIKLSTRHGYFVTKSQFTNLYMVRKFIYYMLGIFILPLLALSSAEGILTYLRSKEKIVQVRLCLSCLANEYESVILTLLILVNSRCSVPLICHRQGPFSSTCC